MARRPISEEERALWQSVAKTARPLKRARKSQRATVAAKAEPKTTPAPKPVKKPKATLKTAPPAPPPAPPPHHELSHGLSTGMDKRQAERFRGGRLPIEGRIDLHGRTQQEAHDDLRAFVTDAHARGKRCVLVITGKGMTAAKAGILKTNVPRWLNEPGLRRHVLAFDYAERQHGGEGALYVLLKRDRKH
jgi:DNA-nicking Smr family endonuclease